MTRLADPIAFRTTKTPSSLPRRGRRNPWRLQAWMGHKRIDETMLYVHVAEAHHRELPEVIRQAAMGEPDPDARILRMLGARGSHAAAELEPKVEKAAITAA